MAKKVAKEAKTEWVYVCDVRLENKEGLSEAKLYQDKATKELKVEAGTMIRRRGVRG
jgi:hypothetical protein